MDQLWWMGMMAVAAVVGNPDSAWGAGSDWQPVVVMVGVATIVALSGLGWLVWVFVVWALRDTGTEAENAEIQDRSGNSQNARDDPWGPRPR